MENWWLKTMSAGKRISSVCRAGGHKFNSSEHTYSEDRSVSRRRSANYTYPFGSSKSGT